VSERDLHIWAYSDDKESLVTHDGQGRLFEQRLWDNLPLSDEKALVLKPGQVHRVTEDVKALFGSLRLKRAQAFKLRWHGWLIVGHEDEGSTLHISNPVTITVRPRGDAK
jgi:hypothetical protein